MPGTFALAIALTALTPAVSSQPSTGPECESILPPTHVAPGVRPLQPEDLAGLRDIGPAEPQYYAEPFFTLSPDRRWAAFQIRRGDPARNRYCVAMVVMDLLGKAAPTIVDEGSEPLLLTSDFRGIADFPTGYMRAITPYWSGDGRWIAFLKRSHGSVQVWRAFADGRGSAPLTRSAADVVDFRIAPDGSNIVYATRPSIDRQEAENEADGLNGWHYDERFVPWMSKRPLARLPVERQIDVLDIETGRLRVPTPEERALVVVDHQIISNAGAPAADAGKGIAISATNLAGGARAGAFQAIWAKGTKATCTRPACEGAMRPWWMPGGTHIRFFRWEGWAGGTTAIYDWNLGNGDVRRLYSTDDVLSSCTPDGDRLLCLADTSLQPRRLVRLDPVSGKRETLFDTNPEFAGLALGKAERLHWRNAFGIETIGDLVFPVGYKPGQRYPMIVVQYDTRGFLRGGTDDEYPIQAFANRGYAVLSFKRPQMVSAARAKDYNEVGRLNLEHFADRRSVQSSLEGGVAIAIGRGIADPARIGITGLSDGTSTVEWALIHSNLFAAAAVSSCCWDSTLVALAGPTAAQHFLDEGYPGTLGRNDPFWREVSLSDNARRIRAPILIHASEEEFLDALLTYSALREAGAAVDLFEYPGEYHARWQPAHRLATYRRSLDWFDFWLRDVRSNSPDRQAEIREWERLKRKADRSQPL